VLVLGGGGPSKQHAWHLSMLQSSEMLRPLVLAQTSLSSVQSLTNFYEFARKAFVLFTVSYRLWISYAL